MKTKTPKSRAKVDTSPTPPQTAGLENLDRVRAGSLADEGGASGAAVETQNGSEADSAETTGDRAAAREAAANRFERSTSPERGAMLFELSIIPTDELHASEELAEVLEVIDSSGLPYLLGPGSTCIEGSWDQVMPVIHACHERARSASKHVITLLKIEDDEGQRDKIRRNVKSVESKAGRKLQSSIAEPSR
jgi:uncharacterized protein YqgV (UPF0045/DUF77 family)